MMLMNPMPSKHQTIRSESINKFELSDCSSNPYYYIIFDVASVRDASPPKPDISIGCSTTHS